MELNEGVIVAQIRNDSVAILGDDEGHTFPNEVIKVLKYICKNFANYIFADNQLIQLIRNEIRKARIEKGRRNLAKEIEELAPYYREDPELTVFSVLDGEDLNEYK